MDDRKRIKHVSSDRLASWAVLHEMLNNIERARVKGWRVSYPYFAAWWIESPGCAAVNIGATFADAQRWIIEHP